jgi:hypothetical protein
VSQSALQPYYSGRAAGLIRGAGWVKCRHVVVVIIITTTTTIIIITITCSAHSSPSFLRRLAVGSPRLRYDGTKPRNGKSSVASKCSVRRLCTCPRAPTAGRGEKKWG